MGRRIAAAEEQESTHSLGQLDRCWVQHQSPQKSTPSIFPLADPKAEPVTMPVAAGWKDHFCDPFTVGLHLDQSNDRDSSHRPEPIFWRKEGETSICALISALQSITSKNQH